MEGWLAILLTILGIIGTIFAGVRYIYKNMWTPLKEFKDTVYKNKEFVDKVMYNLSPNGGNSLVDKVNKIANKLEEIHTDTSIIKHKQKTSSYLDIQPLFECDVQGYCISVNRKWCEITGIDEQSALGYGWISAIHPNDRQRVHDDWERAVETDHQFISTYRFYNKHTNKTIPVKGISRIERDRNGEIMYIIGTFEIIEEPKLTRNEI